MIITPIPSLPLTLRPGRVRTVLLLLTCLGFTALGVFMGRDGEWLGYLIGGLFALGVPVFILQFHPRAAYLSLGQDGFTYCSLFRAHTVRWDTVEGFGVITVNTFPSHVFRMVAWNFVPGYPKTGRAQVLSQAVSGYEAGAARYLRLKPAALADLMNTLHQQWGEPPAEPFFNTAEVERLIKGRPIREPLPFDPTNDEAIRQYYEGLVQRIEREQNLRSRVEWNHYGSGYASFIEAWFYPADDSARLTGREEHHVGLVVLLSRLSRHFVLGQDEKRWSADGSGSGGLPNFSTVDDITYPAILPLVAPLTALLTAAGLQRLRRHDLAAPLPGTPQVPTILTDLPFRQFDALFHWED